MTSPADAPQRAEALDLARSFIVQAPAGSGKTELLTQRFLKLLIQVDRPERILAITFTRKATREMRERILQRLRQAASQSEVRHDHERLAVGLAQQVLQHDAEHGWNLLKNPGRLRVYTIDGLCTQLLARDPERGSHVAGRRISEEPKPLYRQAVQRMFEDLGRDHAGEGDESGVAGEALVRLLVHLDGNTQALGDLLVSMLCVRDQWTRKIGTDSAAIAAVLQDRQAQELQRFAAALGAAELADGMERLARLGGAVDDRDCDAGRFAEFVVDRAADLDVAGPLVGSVSGVISGAASGASFRVAPGEFQLLADPDTDTDADADADTTGIEAALRRAHLFSCVFMTASGTPRGPRGICRKLFKVPGELDDDIAALRELYAGWCSDSEALAVLRRMAATPPLDAVGADSGLRDDIRLILMQALAQLHVLFAEQGTADFAFMAETALQCLGDEDNPGQVLLDEDMRLEHILMDEFQDTSNTQFELLSRLMAGWEPGGSRSLFLVGDPMQSIYRFREANVGLFIDVVQSGQVATIPLTYLRLESNFRSRNEIVDWVNQHFSRIFPPRDQRDSGAVSYAHASCAMGPGGRVQAHPLAPESTDADEALLATALIREAMEQDEHATIAVLARARTHLATLARALIREGIVFDAVKVNPLAARPVIGDLLTITRALAHPADRVAWLALLRAPWCGLTMDELHRVAGPDNRADLLSRLALLATDSAAGVADAGGITAPRGVSAQSLQRVRHVHQVMTEALRHRGSRPLARCVEYAWLRLGGPQACGSRAELENATTFLQRLAELEREDGEDLVGRLMERLQDLYGASAPSRVQLMTVHQAKGLEFDVVIIPGLHRGTGRSDQSLVAVQEFRSANGQDAALMAALPARGSDRPSVYRYLAAVDKERSGYETQRLLYVATTRAKKQLHLLGRYGLNKQDEMTAPSGTLLKLLLPAFVAAQAAAARHEQEQGVTPAGAHLDIINPGSGSSSIPGPRPEERSQREGPIALPLLRLATIPPWTPAFDGAAEGGFSNAGILANPSGSAPVSTADMPAAEVAHQPPEPAQLRPLPSRESAALGDALHHWLELIHDHWDKGWTAEWFEQHPEALSSSLRRAGVTDTRVAELLPKLTHMLIQAVASETGRAIVSPEAGRLADTSHGADEAPGEGAVGATVNKSSPVDVAVGATTIKRSPVDGAVGATETGSWAELVLHRREGYGVSRHIIDRLYRRPDGSLVIIDYKTGADQVSNRQIWADQLQRYRQLINDLGAGEVTGTLVHQPNGNLLIDLSEETTKSG